MKKLFLLFGTIAILSLTFIGCGDSEERLTEEEINAKVDSMYMIEADKLTQEMTLRCTERMTSEVPMRSDQLVIASTDTAVVLEDNTVTTDITENTTVTPTTETDEVVELTDDEIIRNRVDERLATLRTELEMQCEQELMTASRMRADSILQAQGSNATLPPARRQTGTNTGKTTDQPAPGKKSEENFTPGKKSEEEFTPGKKNPQPN